MSEPITHGHGHGHGAPASRRARRLVLALLLPLALATLAALVILWPTSSPAPRTDFGLGQELAQGTVTRIVEEECGGTPESSCLTASIRVTDGPGAGTEITAPSPEGAGAPVLREGDQVVLRYEPSAPPEDAYQITDFQRGRPMAVLAVVFAAAIVALARWRGLSALVGLAASFGVLLTFVLPAILAGTPPLLVAVVGSSAIMFVVLYATHGFSISTSVAVLGTLASLVLTGVLGAAFTVAGHFTGLGSEEASFVSTLYSDVDLRGLLLAGIVIGTLGVLDDVTVTQASTVTELARANPMLPRRSLFAGAMRVGRAHIGSTVNTLVLAYAGASLPLLLLFSASRHGVTDLVTNEAIAQEVVRSAVGTVGLVAAVPVTTALAVLLTTQPGRQTPIRGRRRRT
jgi:uncharacterized membrane protein